jgi:alpha/beta superfamily hydrolase
MRIKGVKFDCTGFLLEGKLSIPEGTGPFTAIIVCHPHPLYGGNMDNNVVIAVADSLSEAGILSLRFNFRGVGNSGGSYGHGIGEQEDVKAALNFLTATPEVKPDGIGLIGYSAGASFALPVGAQDERIKALGAISPTISMTELSYLENSLKPKLLISGSLDDFTPANVFLSFCQKLTEPKKYLIIEGADHFWSGFEIKLAAHVTRFFTGAFK